MDPSFVKTDSWSRCCSIELLSPTPTGGITLCSSQVPRFLDRSGVFKQSKGRVNVVRENGPKILWAQGLFHSILHKDTRWVILGVFVVYVASFIVFAPFFWLLRDR